MSLADVAGLFVRHVDDSPDLGLGCKNFRAWLLSLRLRGVVPAGLEVSLQLLGSRLIGVPTHLRKYAPTLPRTDVGRSPSPKPSRLEIGFLCPPVFQCVLSLPASTDLAAQTLSHQAGSLDFSFAVG